jgi:putative ATPase
MPECRINLAHVVTYLSEAPKSTRALEGYNRARELAQQDMTLPVPMPMRNAPTGMMKELGYGEGYMYQPKFSYGHPFSGNLPVFRFLM